MRVLVVLFKKARKTEAGAKLTATLLRELARRTAPSGAGGGNRYGMVTMCVGGGMGAAGIFESLA